MSLKNFIELLLDLDQRDQTVKDMTTNKVVSLKEIVNTYPGILLNAKVYYNNFTIIHSKGRILFSFNY